MKSLFMLLLVFITVSFQAQADEVASLASDLNRIMSRVSRVIMDEDEFKNRAKTRLKSVKDFRYLYAEFDKYCNYEFKIKKEHRIFAIKNDFTLSQTTHTCDFNGKIESSNYLAYEERFIDVDGYQGISLRAKYPSISSCKMFSRPFKAGVEREEYDIGDLDIVIEDNDYREFRSKLDRYTELCEQ